MYKTTTTTINVNIIKLNNIGGKKCRRIKKEKDNYHNHYNKRMYNHKEYFN